MPEFAKLAKTEAYRMSAGDVMDELSTGPQGITETQAIGRLARFGSNQLAGPEHEALASRFWRELKTPPCLLLLAAAGISLYLGDRQVAVILCAFALVNASLNFLREYKSERLTRNLRKLLPAETKVVRRGKLVAVPAAGIVMGDVVYIEASDLVPADLRLFDAAGLSIDDTVLTGGPGPSRKFTQALTRDFPMSQRHNLAYAGTVVAEGHGFGVALATGEATELGRLASFGNQHKSAAGQLYTVLQQNRRRGIYLAAILPLLGLIALHTNLTLQTTLWFAAAVMVALVPIGLPYILGLLLTFASRRLGAGRIHIKKLSAVYSLGNTNVLCVDVGGMLTSNQPAARQLWLGGKQYRVSGENFAPAGHIFDDKGKKLTERSLKALRLFFAAAAFTADAILPEPGVEQRQQRSQGQLSGVALLALARKAGLNERKLLPASPQLREFPFDPDRGRKSSIRDYNNQRYVFVQGFPEAVLETCTHLWRDGKIRRLTAANRQQILSLQSAASVKTQQLIALAYKKLPRHTDIDKLTLQKAEAELIYFGTIGLDDSLHPTTAAAVQSAREAGITLVVVTDTPETMTGITAVQAGLVKKPSHLKVVTGGKLAKLSDAQIVTAIHKNTTAFLRLQPSEKQRLVAALAHSGKTVTFAGKNLSDIPALQAAAAGVVAAPAIQAVAESADAVLLDSSLDTLTKAVLHSRQTARRCRVAIQANLLMSGGLAAALLLGLLLNVDLQTQTATAFLLIAGVHASGSLVLAILLGRLRRR